jgi:PAS domain S-box-containing protein
MKGLMNKKNTNELIAEIKKLQKHIASLESKINNGKKFEEECNNSKRILNSILNNIPDIVYRLDAEGKITFINDVVKKYNYQPEELIGRHIFDLVHPDDLEKAKYKVKERRTGDRRTISFEVRMLSSKKSPIPVEIRSTGLYEQPVFLLQAEGLYRSESPKPNTFLGTQAIARDISDMKKMEAQLLQAQKMQAVGLLAGGVAHDFNNLLTVILGYTEKLLKSYNQSEPNYKDIKHIKNSANSAAALTSQLLAFSRRQVLKPEITNLNVIISKLENMLKRMIKEDIELILDLDKNLANIKTDTSKIEQIIMNLVTNACDAMHDGGKLKIETKNVLIDENYATKYIGFNPGPFVQMTISDTGEGMNEKTLENIFDPFFTTKEIGKGTGLGLATVYGIIKQSHGNIFVDSELGKGTTFNIFLPQCDEELLEIESTELPDKKVSPTETIMVVEDQTDVRELIVHVLKEYGYNIIESVDGEDALAKCKKYNKDIHLLITDVIMPKLNGLELREKLLVSYPNIKVIFMSGYADNVIGKMGVLDIDKIFIEKPFVPSKLISKIREILNNN